MDSATGLRVSGPGASGRVAHSRRRPVRGHALVVAVTARPVDGQANRAVVAALAEAFGVRRSAVELVSGQSGRDKTVFIAGDPTALSERLRALRDH